MGTSNRRKFALSHSGRVLTVLSVSIICMLVPLHQSRAAYDANVAGKITYIFTYPSGKVYIKLDSQPTSHPTCNPALFAMHPAASGYTEAGIDRMYARALAAYVAGDTITIGYDSQTNCVASYIRIERVG